MKTLSAKNTVPVFKWLTLLLFGFPVLPFAIRSILIGCWIAVAIVTAYQNKLKITKTEKFGLLVLALPFLLLIVSAFYSTNQNSAWDYIFRISPLIVFPVIYLKNKDLLTPKLFDIAKIVFIISVSLLSLEGFWKSWQQKDYLNRPLTEIEIKYNGMEGIDIIPQVEAEIKYRRFKKFVEDSTNTHSTYFGIFIIFCLYIIGEILFDKHKKFILKILLVLIGAGLLAWLSMLSVRGPLIAFFVGLLAVMVFKHRNLKYIFASIAGSLLILTTLYMSVPSMKLRVDEVIENKFSLPEEGKDPLKFNSTNVRLGSFYCSLEIFKEQPLTGVGVGDVQQKLDDCYQSKIGAVIYNWNTYNNHNQYFYFADAAGIFGLLAFGCFVFYLIGLSIRRRDAIGIFFFVSASLLFMSENVLYRSDGITYFAVIGFFIIYRLRKNDSY